jgi:hypothetical protein|nr:MAG TPA: hypothetical protein [Caudoviricetes sp.]
MIVEKILQEELEELRKDLIAKYQELGMRSTGEWERGLETEVIHRDGGYSGVITGLDYTYYMQWGRAEGRMPPVGAILEWIEAKGLRPVEEKMKVSTLAYLIARKIGREGTRRYQDGGVPAFVDAVITEDRIQRIMDRVGEGCIVRFESEIIDIIRAMVA